MHHRAPYEGRAFIADTSAWLHASYPSIRDQWTEALVQRQIATCPVVVLEVLYSTRDADEFDRWSAGLAELRDVPITRSVTHAAKQAFRSLAHTGARQHRSVGVGDLLIAACAQDVGIGVLHYDHDFDRLAEVMAFESRWIAPRGSLA
jgi:predicted nucleic acid-binding protein